MATVKNGSLWGRILQNILKAGTERGTDEEERMKRRTALSAFNEANGLAGKSRELREPVLRQVGGLPELYQLTDDRFDLRFRLLVVHKDKMAASTE